MEEEFDAQTVRCSKCGKILYQGIELKPIDEIIKSYNGKCPECGKILNPPNTMDEGITPATKGKSEKSYKKPSRLWYLLPIFLSIIGGIAGYFIFKDKDRKFAKRLLIVGIVMLVVGVIAWILLAGLAYMYISGIMTSRTASTISILDISCSDGIITTVISNDGTQSIPISSIEFFLNQEETIPSECSGYIESHSTVVCKLGDKLSGSQKVEIKSPSNTVTQSVWC